MTRKWKDNCLLQLVRLFLIDEVSVFFRFRTIFLCPHYVDCVVCVILFYLPTSWLNLWNLSEANILFIQVHVVKDETRGATLEVVVSRMKAVHTYRTTHNQEAGLSMRFVAVSATIPNISDVSTCVMCLYCILYSIYSLN